jgi:hypothetical protein
MKYIKINKIMEIFKSESASESDDISSAQGKPTENQQTSSVISYSEPNSVPPSQGVHHTDQNCLPIDNCSEKQTTDRKEIEGSTSPCDTSQDKIESSRAFNRIITTSDEDHNHRQNADPFGPANSLSPHIPPQAPEKGASNSLTQESAKHIRRLYERFRY